VSIDPHALPPTPARVCSQALVASVPSFPARGSLGERLRQHRAASLDRIRSFHAGGGAGLSTARLVTAAADAALGALWDVLAPAHKLQGAVLIAVGGSGRREMSPGSDWDLLLLHTGRGEVASFARAFTTALWDARVHLGWSVRTLAEATTAAREDTDLRTALLDARRLAGDGRLWSRAERSLLAEQRTRDADAFVQAKTQELRARREKFGDTVFLLEPNVKNGQGGLRDLEAALWVAQVRFHARTLGQVLERGILPRHDVAEARAARDFLLRVRHAAHLAGGRKEDRLTFELQSSLAQELGYRTGPEGEAVERFMRHVYLAAGTLRRESEAVLARAEEERAPRRIFRPERRVGHFKVFRGRLTVDDGELFGRSPAEVVRMFQLAGELGVPLYSWARERITEALPALVDARGTPEVVEALKALFTSPAGRGAVLDEMHALGVLGALVPEFGRITAHHQNDLYHVYTVDVHTLRALRRLYALRAGDLVDVEPEIGRLIADLLDPLPLFLGMLLHDAGKGMGGDHSVRGKELMAGLGERLGLTPRQREVAEFLVLHHLTMSQTAQRRDLSDPELIRWFADLCGDVEKLGALYLLTWADMSSVAPGMWNAWRAGLVHELYRKAQAALSGQEMDHAAREPFAEAWTRALGEAEAGRLLESLPDRYFDATPPADALRHARLLRRARRYPVAAVLRRMIEGHAEVHVAAPDAPGLLATWSGVLAAHGLDILTARIVSTLDGYALDVFEVRGRAGRPVERTRWRRARADLVAAARGELDVPALLARRRGGKLLHRVLPPVATRVSVDNRASLRFTVVDVRGEDRVGLLHDLAAALAGAQLEIAVAKVATEANRAIDSFYVTRRGSKLTEPGEVNALRAQLAAAVPAPTVEG
jgi:[protein-PII] uridylyltransferase